MDIRRAHSAFFIFSAKAAVSTGWSLPKHLFTLHTSQRRLPYKGRSWPHPIQYHQAKKNTIALTSRGIAATNSKKAPIIRVMQFLNKTVMALAVLAITLLSASSGASAAAPLPDFDDTCEDACHRQCWQAEGDSCFQECMAICIL